MQIRAWRGTYHLPDPVVPSVWDSNFINNKPEEGGKVTEELENKLNDIMFDYREYASHETTEELVNLIQSERRAEREYVLQQIDSKIGFLRQWLNEDRVTDPRKLVKSEQISNWLEINQIREEGL